MNFLIEMGHPAHVHFFAPTIKRLKTEGHGVTVVTRGKDMTNSLLERMGIPFLCLSLPARGKTSLALELIGRWYKIAKILRREKIDVAASISGISTSIPARLLGVRNIVFTDTEDAFLSNRIALPFADLIYTPQFFLNDLGAKQRRYRGLHELAYLQKSRESEPNAAPYCVLRLIGNDALHDKDLKDLTEQEILALVKRLESYGRVYISSTRPLPEALRGMELRIAPETIHPFLAAARIFVGESPTMAVESSLLGTPAYLLSARSKRLGNMIGLEKEQLLRNFSDAQEVLAALPKEEDLAAEKMAWQGRAKKFREQSQDMAALIYQALMGEKT